MSRNQKPDSRDPNEEFSDSQGYDSRGYDSEFDDGYYDDLYEDEQSGDGYVDEQSGDGFSDRYVQDKPAENKGKKIGGGRDRELSGKGKKPIDLRAILDKGNDHDTESRRKTPQGNPKKISVADLKNFNKGQPITPKNLPANAKGLAGQEILPIKRAGSRILKKKDVLGGKGDILGGPKGIPKKKNFDKPEPRKKSEIKKAAVEIGLGGFLGYDLQALKKKAMAGKKTGPDGLSLGLVRSGSKRRSDSKVGAGKKMKKGPPTQIIKKLTRKVKRTVIKRIKTLKSHSEINIQVYSTIDPSLQSLLERNAPNEKFGFSYKTFVGDRRSRLTSGEPILADLCLKLEHTESQRALLWGMCSKSEIILRQEEDGADTFERQIGGQKQQLYSDRQGFDDIYAYGINPDFAVKRYQRSAADKILDNPSNIRPGHVLLETINYILELMDDDRLPKSRYAAPEQKARGEWIDVYSFCRDRFRGIQQDIVIMSSHCENFKATMPVIQSLELSARFLILSIDEGSDTKGFDPHDNVKLLSATLETLQDAYNIARRLLKNFYEKASKRFVAKPAKNRIHELELIIYISPNQPEFICYQLLLVYFNEKGRGFTTKLSFY